jgi:hypothetical protein
MTSALNLCDMLYYGRIADKDIYAIYYTPELTKESVKEYINNLVKVGKVEYIIKNENAHIDAAIGYINDEFYNDYHFFCDDTVFWDVWNHIIITTSRDSNLKMAYVLETEALRDLRLLGPVNDLINDHSIHSFTKKAKEHYCN